MDNNNNNNNDDDDDDISYGAESKEMIPRRALQ